jgi:deazaflavin-dependent oxidoreductase (nitroreductase family)
MALLNTGVIKTALDSPTTVALLKRTVPRLDRALMRGSRGWINTAMQSVALVETIGAKSGQARTIVTLCMPVGQDLILVASNWGQDRHPVWYHNLKANPDVQVTFRGYVGDVHASELKGRQRSEMWQRLVAYNPQYGRYQSANERCIPVLQLRRVALN